MLKKVMTMFCAAALVLVGVCSVSFESEASSSGYTVYKMLMDRPQTDNLSGYLEILMRNDSNGTLMARTYFWYLTSSGTEINNVGMSLTINSSNINFQPLGASETNLRLMQSDGMTSPWYVFQGVHDPYNGITNSFSGYTVVSFRYYGNVSYCSTTVSNYNTGFLVAYNMEYEQYEQMLDIYNELVENNADNQDIIAKLDNILKSNDSIDSKLSQLLEMQEESNNWLEKIFNYLNESQEQQKEAAEAGASSSASDASSSINDESAGFVDSLGGLGNSMSYTGTQCAWSFPQVKLPAIAGVMDEVVLIEAQPIDFAFWVNKLPSGVLLVVQSVCTLGLIVYCFKELYSLISYVFTMRGGGADE